MLGIKVSLSAPTMRGPRALPITPIAASRIVDATPRVVAGDSAIAAAKQGLLPLASKKFMTVAATIVTTREGAKQKIR